MGALSLLELNEGQRNGLILHLSLSTLVVLALNAPMNGPLSAPPRHTGPMSQTEPLVRLADGTVKQVNPITGTRVWTVPGRGNRPLAQPTQDARPLEPGDRTHFCAFCSGRYSETTPEKSRLLALPDGELGAPGATLAPAPSPSAGGPASQPAGLAADSPAPASTPTPAASPAPGFLLQEATPASALHATTAAFRRIPNLFEILSFDYWRLNHGFTLPEQARAHMSTYLAEPEGREHVAGIARTKLRASGQDPAAWDTFTPEQQADFLASFFASSHDVLVAARHFTPEATTTAELASSGTLSPEEHRAYIRLAVDSAEDLYATNPWARYVAVFQNWLRPAGASFDHLHKQLVAIDERGVSNELELQRLRDNPDLYNAACLDYAADQGLIVAENEHAVAFAGFGHRYPTLEVFSTSPTCEPWRMRGEEVDAMSDLLHALHAATGPDVPCNEEWHHKPADVTEPMPWHITLKWRVSTLAGFEGGTKIYLNTIDPWMLRDRILPRLKELREAGRIAPMRLGSECSTSHGRLRYGTAL